MKNLEQTKIQKNWEQTKIKKKKKKTKDEKGPASFPVLYAIQRFSLSPLWIRIQRLFL